LRAFKTIAKLELSLMKRRTVGLLSIVLGVLLALPALSQVGHPVKGSWLGYWGPNDEEQHRILLLLDWENREISGTINPGRNAVPIDNADLDVSTWTLRIEAEMPVENEVRESFVLTGQLDNLGSWRNRRYFGTYRHGEETGTFLMTLN
jgi:hypothetical protein